MPHSAPSSRPPPPEGYAVLDAFSEAAALIESGGAIVRVNPAFKARFGPGPWAGEALDRLLIDPLDRHAAPWRRAASSSHPVCMRVRLADAGEMTAAITVKKAGEGVWLATLTPRVDLDGLSLAETRLDLAQRMGGFSAWRHDLDSGEGWVEGALADAYPGPYGFGPAVWRGNVHPDDIASLTAAFLAMEFGGRLDHSFRVRAADGRWRWRHACGAREPLFGPAGRRASGFLRDAGVAEDEVDVAEHDAGGEAQADPAEAAASAQMSAWTYDLKTRRLRLTGPILQRLGLPGLPGKGAELDILDWRARVPDEDQAQMDKATLELNRDGVTEVEYRVRAEDGALVWLSLRGGVSEQDAAGAVLRFSGFISEIGVRKQLEHKLAERERQLSEAVEAGLIGIWAIDLATGRQTVQGRLAGWMGAGPDGAVGPEAWRAVIHEREFQKAFAAYQAVSGGEAFPTFEYRLRSPEGWRWARTTGRIVERDPAGRPMRAAGVVIDISAERAFATALSAEKRRFETVYRNTPALMLTFDTNGRTLMVSDYWVARMGHLRDAAIGKPAWSFFTKAGEARLRDEIIPRSLREGVIANAPLTGLTKSGEHIEVRLSAFWERDESGRPVRAHCVFAEVGDLNAARRELEAQNDELARVNRELNRFTTIASHDLQEPLRKISAFASLLRRRYLGTLDPEADQSLDFLIDAAGRMRTLIDDLLAYSRASNRLLEPEAVDLDAVWRETIEAHDLHIAEAEAVVEAGRLPVVEGDRILLKLLFSNLLSNALKYRKGPGVRISVKGFVRHGEACLTLADDGIGFDPKFAEKVFEPFARLHGREAYAGTGIGLAICQQAVERQGGRIWVESAPGEGTRFHFTLPTAEAEAGAA